MSIVCTDKAETEPALSSPSDVRRGGPIWPSYVISMDVDGARAASAADQLTRAGVPFSIMGAVNGRRLEESRIREVFDRELNRKLYKYPLSQPEMGCYLSHYKLWQEIADRPDTGAFIFEDDFKAREDLGDILRGISAQTFGPDVISLHQAKPPIYRRVGAIGPSVCITEPWIGPARSTAYGITRKAARKIVSKCLPFARPVDIDLKHWWEFGIRLLSLDPGIVENSGLAESTIEGSRSEIRRTKTKASRFFTNLQYQARFHRNLVLARLGASIGRPGRA